jgi:glycine hydroxymethyltransferase
MLIDLTGKDVSGKDAQDALDRASITVNKNGIPFDTRGPQVTSGIRVGTPAVTTRGMKENEMRLIASYMADVIKDINNEQKIKAVAEKVKTLCDQFPLYQGRIKNL